MTHSVRQSISPERSGMATDYPFSMGIGAKGDNQPGHIQTGEITESTGQGEVEHEMLFWRQEHHRSLQKVQGIDIRLSI